MSPESLGWWLAGWLALQPGPSRPQERAWADLIARANVALDVHDHWKDRLSRQGLELRPEAMTAEQGLIREMDLAQEQWRAGRWQEAAETMQRASAWVARLEREQR